MAEKATNINKKEKLEKFKEILDGIEELSDGIILTIAYNILKDGKYKEGKKKGKKLKDLLDDIHSVLSTKFDINISKIYRVLREEAKKENGRIKSGGPHRGYFYVDQEEEIKEKNKLDELNEADFYPIVELWMENYKGYSIISDASNKKKGGVWGNPDVVGIIIYEDFGIKYIEITTAEVKLSLNDWKRQIFEAVSHKRFSDKVYFVFGIMDESELQDIDILHYAEKYKIGLVYIKVGDNEMINKIKNWNDLEESEKFEVMDNCIMEIFPAPNDDAHIREKLKFLQGLGVSFQYVIN